MDGGTDRTKDSTEDGRWLTYNELAEIRHIDRHSAVKLVMRRGWRRQKDNRGALRILVPTEWALSKDKGVDKGTHKGTDRNAPAANPSMDMGTDTGTDISRAIIALEAAVSSITSRAEYAEKRAEKAEIRAKSAEDRANLAEGELTKVRNSADRAIFERDAHQNRADGLETRLEEVLARAETAERDRASAVAIADEAVKAAEELRQAQADRKSRGRWARLRAAWRGN